MKVKYCLMGLALLAMPAQVQAWGWFTSIVNWVVDIFVPPPAPVPAPAPTPAPTPKPTLSKTIVMRANIVPTWEELAPPGAVKIKLGRVADYWSGLLASDIQTYQSLFTTAAQKDATKATIVTYYDEADKCLKQQSLTTPSTPEVFNALIETVRVCLSKSTIPTFVVADTNMITPALPMYVPANHFDPDDYAPPPTAAPTLVPDLVVNDLEPISIDTLETRTHEPWVFDEPIPMDIDMPGKNGAGIPPLMTPPVMDGWDIPPLEPAPPLTIKEPEPAVPNWAHKVELHPRVATVPDFRTLDTNNDGLMTSDEWLGFVQHLDAKALETASKTDDKQGLALLTKIIAHHYNRLTNCVTAVTSQAAEKAVDAADFQALAPSIDASCNVKFRYSLLAGPPPFEWVAGHKPTVTAEHVSKWFAAELQKAGKESSDVPLSASGAVSCIGNSLEGNRYESVDRAKFYSTINKCF